MDDVDFLALLVHRGHLEQQAARELVPELKSGAALDELLESALGWEPERIAELRRTRAGELVTIPGYDIRERVGVGGTANVFLARDKKTKRLLVLKVLKPEASQHKPTLAAFVQEAKLLQRLEHPGLVKGMGVARSGATYFCRLEYIQGATLLELLDGGRDFSESEALDVILRVAEVLLYLEAERIVHRDVKPGNIMLDGKGRVVLIDLGFAVEGGASAEQGSATGTVAYLSPEQARGGAQADIRSDIYSLGISLFHIVVGRLPFESSDDREVLRMQVMESLSSRELKGRSISVHMQYFIEKMVAKEAADRYQNWSELIRDVKEQLEGFDSMDFTHDPRRRRP